MIIRGASTLDFSIVYRINLNKQKHSEQNRIFSYFDYYLDIHRFWTDYIGWNHALVIKRHQLSKAIIKKCDFSSKIVEAMNVSPKKWHSHTYNPIFYSIFISLYLRFYPQSVIQQNHNTKYMINHQK